MTAKGGQTSEAARFCASGGRTAHAALEAVARWVRDPAEPERRFFADGSVARRTRDGTWTVDSGLAFATRSGAQRRTATYYQREKRWLLQSVETDGPQRGRSTEHVVVPASGVFIARPRVASDHACVALALAETLLGRPLSPQEVRAAWPCLWGVDERPSRYAAAHAARAGLAPGHHTLFFIDGSVALGWPAVRAPQGEPAAATAWTSERSGMFDVVWDAHDWGDGGTDMPSFEDTLAGEFCLFVPREGWTLRRLAPRGFPPVVAPASAPIPWDEALAGLP